MPRFASQTQSEPPSRPVYSYHWTVRVLRAKAPPSVSQGQEMSTAKYCRSQAIHVAARKM